MSATPTPDQVNVAIGEFVHALGLDPRAVRTIAVSADEDPEVYCRAVVVEQMVFDTDGSKRLGEFVTSRFPWSRVAANA